MSVPGQRVIDRRSRKSKRYARYWNSDSPPDRCRIALQDRKRGSQDQRPKKEKDESPFHSAILELRRL